MHVLTMARLTFALLLVTYTAVFLELETVKATRKFHCVFLLFAVTFALPSITNIQEKQWIT